MEPLLKTNMDKRGHKLYLGVHTMFSYFATVNTPAMRGIVTVTIYGRHGGLTGSLKQRLLNSSNRSPGARVLVNYKL